ncbi:ABC transporter ATP-binding protein [Coprococcus sp. HCN-4056]|uniref:ABC transporter ATP-binding protein n=1 Tax=Coprococcus sp. HCN-4056 TaxID=3134671 RepID=UPI0030BF4571
MEIEVRNLTKKYKNFTAVDHISFNVLKGEVVGFIGANGAGKSTTIKMMTGILTPDDGSVTISGLNYKKNRREILLKMGVVFGQRSVLCWDIPIMESFKLFRDMYRIPKSLFEDNLEIFADILNISEYINKPPRQLSLGQRMKADLAAALLYNPEILFLDEPTIGIDVLAKSKMREFIQTINRERKTTIVITTHDMSDIEALCEKTIIIDKGKILYNGTIQELLLNYADSDGKYNLEKIVKEIYEGDYICKNI